jgi:thiosulfate/3-mercaptopyruvate sulfurtransferase
VIVVGRGKKGLGEEGRLAWTLRYLGVSNVAAVSLDYFKLPLSNLEAPSLKPAAMWSPALDESLVVAKEVFEKIVQNPRDPHSGPIVVDVRSEKEYLGREASDFGVEIPNIGAINIPYEEFFDELGLPQRDLVSRLNQVGITGDREVIVISEQGVRSAAVTLALREMGFKRTKNFAGGYRQFLLENRNLKKSNKEKSKKSKSSKSKKSQNKN